MAWQTPKTDWATDDAIATADLNRIEENIRLLNEDVIALDKIHYSASVANGVTIVAGAYENIGLLAIAIPAAYSLKLKCARYAFPKSGGGDASLRLYVAGYKDSVVDLLSWESTVDHGDDEPDEYLFSNDTGTEYLAWLSISVHNSHVSESKDTSPGSCALELAIEAGLAPTTTTTTAGA